MTPNATGSVETNGWQRLSGVGPKTAAVIAQAWSGASSGAAASNYVRVQRIWVAARSGPRYAAIFICIPTGPTARRRSTR